MNPNGDEKRIRQLFREMSRDDQQRLPEFASVLATDSGSARSKSRIRSLRFAVAGALLCAGLLIAMTIIVRPSKPGPAGDADQAEKILQPQPPSIVIPSQSGNGIITVKPRTHIIKHARHLRRSNEIEIAMKSLFAWQSPTATLLPAPGGDELLRSLPRLGEPFQTIKSFSPDEFN